MRDPVRKPLAATTQPLPWENLPTGPNTPLKREKRAYRKRKHLKSGLSRPTLPGLVTVGGLLLPAHVQEALSSDDDRASINMKQSDQELEEEEMEGPFSFKRKAGVEYHSVLGPDPLARIQSRPGGSTKDSEFTNCPRLGPLQATRGDGWRLSCDFLLCDVFRHYWYLVLLKYFKQYQGDTCGGHYVYLSCYPV